MTPDEQAAKAQRAIELSRQMAALIRERDAQEGNEAVWQIHQRIRDIRPEALQLVVELQGAGVDMETCFPEWFC